MIALIARTQCGNGNVGRNSTLNGFFIIALHLRRGAYQSTLVPS